VPSPDVPLTGSCACGEVAFQVTAPFQTAGYCHCKRCQRRSGALWSLNAMAPTEGFTIVRGEQALRTWTPPDGLPKAFCAACGGHLYSDGGDVRGVRLGVVDGDPGIRPEWHQWVESAPDWEAIPDDGLPRFPRSRREG
jgi:hypothetical protein